MIFSTKVVIVHIFEWVFPRGMVSLELDITLEYPYR